MILMALDHVREYFGGVGVSPTNLATTTVPLFFTRWVTHLCAPVFFLLTGTGAYLAGRTRGPRALARYLGTRGVWLIFLDAVALRCLGWQFNVDYRATVLNVLWALGWSMIGLAALVRFTPRTVAVVGAIMIAGHNLLDPIQPSAFGPLAPIWTVLHVPGAVLNTPRAVVLVAYPLIPWVGVMAVGYGLGSVLDLPSERRQRVLLRLGVALSLGFAVVRAIDLYGDPSRWSQQRSAVYTALSFLNTTKYPPSLLFLLMTLGPALIILWAFDRGMPAALRPTPTIGKVPLFYFAVHIIVIHLLAVVVCGLRYGAVHWMFESPDLGHFPISEPPGWPVGLLVVYAIWIGLVVALYPLCRWYAGVKRRSDSAWFSYL
jgi:uncharacterized membrane protein